MISTLSFVFSITYYLKLHIAIYIKLLVQIFTKKRCYCSIICCQEIEIYSK